MTHVEENTPGEFSIAVKKKKKMAITRGAWNNTQGSQFCRSEVCHGSEYHKAEIRVSEAKFLSGGMGAVSEGGGLLSGSFLSSAEVVHPCCFNKASKFFADCQPGADLRS